MQAADMMTSNVLTVRPDMPVREVAKLLIDHQISAVPVVDEADRPVGIVSEGDLVRRTEIGTETGRSWWLDLFTSTENRASRFLKEHGHTAGQVMSRKLVTVAEDTPLPEIARLLEKHRIKRVPVLRDGRIVGIVSRANILRGLAAAEPAPVPTGTSADDREIRRAVLRHLSDAGVAPTVGDATVTNGRVELWGIARDDVEERAAIAAAEEVPGVVSVESNLGRVPDYTWGY